MIIGGLYSIYLEAVLLLCFLFIGILTAIVIHKDRERLNIRKRGYDFLERINQKQNLRYKNISRMKKKNELNEVSFMYKVDIFLKRAGVNISTESYILLMGCLFIGIAVIASLTGLPFFLAVIAGVASCLCVYVFFVVRIRKNEEAIDGGMVQFLNLLESFTSTSDDIVYILSACAEYVTGPIYPILKNFVNDVNLYGDLRNSFVQMADTLGNTMMAECIRNIDICSMHEANYKIVAEDMRATVLGTIKSKNIKKSMTANAKVDVITLLFAFVVIIYMIDNFLSQASVLQILMGSVVGNVILGISILVFLYAFVSIISIN